MNLSELPIDKLEQIEAELLKGLGRLKFYEYFPDSGPYRRELYKKHIAFFNGSKQHSELLFLAANRIGKTLAGAYATVAHTTGRYPAWWEGRRFDSDVQAWAVGKTSETARDVVQFALCGPPEAMGTGMIPAEDIIDFRFKQGTNQSLDWITVRPKKGKTASRIGLKSYDQGRKAFEGTARKVVWLDEEPPMGIYTECLTRTATVNGIIYTTFTPLEGATEMVNSFLVPPDGVKVVRI
jgi:phage terminase large subunit-like protein